MRTDRDLEVVELDSSEDNDVYSPGRLISVAGLGALLSLGLYYVYQQLDEDNRNSLRRKASGLMADQFQRLSDDERPPVD